MTFTGAEPLEINIPVIIAASGEKVTLNKTIWSDKEIEPVFYAGEKGPYLIVDLCDTNGRALVDLKNGEPYYFIEWWRCLSKELVRKARGKHCVTEYCFTETGDEYWYQTDGFRRHYTKIEG